jgi:hypothetical protein
MRTYLILLGFIPIIIFTNCDGYLAVRGYVLSDDFIKSHTISDSLFNDFQLSNGIGGVQIYIDPAVKDLLINQEHFEEFGFKTITDSNGYFEFGEVFAPGKWVTGIVASKKDFLSDTVYFNNDLEQINLIISLKKTD